MHIKKRELGWCFSCVAICFGMLPRQSEAQAPEPASVSAAGAQVRDANGRVAYLVELKAGAATGYSMERRDSGRFASYQRGNVVNLIEELEWTHRVTAISMTSLASTTFTAYLDEDQRQELLADDRIEGLIPDVYMTFSDADTTAVWNDSAATTLGPPYGLWNGRLTSLTTEIRPWGQAAVTNTNTSSNGRALVYVVDSGVNQHEDLNVIEWVNTVNPTGALCGTRTGVAGGLPTCTTAIMPKVVGCYSHSTGVAGIIGAKINGVGTKGVLPNAKIISVSALDPAVGGAACLTQPNPTATNVKNALEWVANDIAANVHTGIPAVVNLSTNFFTSAERNLISPEMVALGSGSPGALVVQSAGNDLVDACTEAYAPKNSNDGIVVVGAINSHGQPVVPLNGALGFWREWTNFAHEKGSNNGSCVEAWAPGDLVLMPVGDVFASNNANVVYHSYAFGGGTSFAAPHVAGLAAYLIDNTTTLTTAKQVEQSINTHLASLGSHDSSAAALPIKLPTVVTLPTPHNTPYAELMIAIGGSCRYPPFETNPPPNCSAIVNADPQPCQTLVRNRSAALNQPPINVFLDSWGAGTWTCDVDVGEAGVGYTTIGNTTNGHYTNHNFPATTNQQVFSTICPNASILVVSQCTQ